MPRGRLGRFHMPSPSIVIAVVAVILCATGFAVAAIPDSKGVIHACYAKDSGALRVVKGTKCRKNEKRLAWNQKGRSGLTNLTVRQAVVTLTYTCTSNGSFFNCTAGPTSGTAHCNGAERATGGGSGQVSDGAFSQAQESRPEPASGKPTGWTVTLLASASQSGSTRPDASAPIYAVCAAP